MQTHLFVGHFKLNYMLKSNFKTIYIYTPSEIYIECIIFIDKYVKSR